jgi:hypothetical protein
MVITESPARRTFPPGEMNEASGSGRRSSAETPGWITEMQLCCAGGKRLRCRHDVVTAASQQGSSPGDAIVTGHCSTSRASGKTALACRASTEPASARMASGHHPRLFSSLSLNAAASPVTSRSCHPGRADQTGIKAANGRGMLLRMTTTLRRSDVTSGRGTHPAEPICITVAPPMPSADSMPARRRRSTL